MISRIKSAIWVSIRPSSLCATSRIGRPSGSILWRRFASDAKKSRTIPFYQIKLHCLQEMMRVLEGVSVKRRKRRRAWRSDGAALRISWRLWRNAEIRLRMLRMRTI